MNNDSRRIVIGFVVLVIFYFIVELVTGCDPFYQSFFQVCVP